MADYKLVVGLFEDPDRAHQALPLLRRAAKAQHLKVHDTATIRRTAEGDVEIFDAGDWDFWKGSLVAGALTGAAIVAGPLGWGALAAGTVGGGLIAEILGANFDADALRALGAKAKQARSALVVMVDPPDEDTIAAVLTAEGAVATTVGLDEATAARLAEAFNVAALTSEHASAAA